MISVAMSQLQTKEFWDLRYEQEDSFDWFLNYEKIKGHLDSLISQQDTILMLGCGNSTLSEELYNSGYKHIINVDFSQVCVEAMQKKYEKEAEMSWLVADVREMGQCISDSTIDIALDKGTLDALRSYEGSPWDPPVSVKESISQYIAEVIRVLRAGGKFIWISFTQPHFAKPHLAHEDIGSVNIHQIGSEETLPYFIYILRKRGC